MAPSAISTTPNGDVQGVSELTASAIAQKLADAPSVEDDSNRSTLAPLDASLLKSTRTTSPMTVPAVDDPIVYTSSQCTDHMITAKWTAHAGWEAPELKPYGPLAIMPTASVLHYATECFEGMKLYRGYDGKLRLFRPDCNARRMITSATRISLPSFDAPELEKLISKLCEVDGEKWLPKSRAGNFLYLRPSLIGSAPGLGVQIPKEATLFIIACMMPNLDNPNGMKLLASKDDMVRAWPGGFGYAKVGANYGPSLMAQQEARSRGYDQVLWLLGDECNVTEAGASNFFVVWRTRKEEGGKLQIVTAPIGDKIILDGVTRRSVLQLARERLTKAGTTTLEEVEIVERKFVMNDIVEAVKEDRMVEAFVCGTAFFVCSIAQIHFRGADLNIPMVRGDSGEYAAILKSWVHNIMYGKESHPWGIVLNEEENN